MRWVVVVAAALASACGSSGDDDGSPAGGTGGTGGAGGTGGHGAGAGGTAGAAAASGKGGSSAGGAGSSGSAGAANLDCTGTFGEPVTVFTVPAETGIGSLALRADELELIYNETPFDLAMPSHFRRSVRASKDVPFTQGELLESLNALCDLSPSRTGDLTSDGLRFYFTCHEDFSDLPAAIHLARRTSLDAPFVVDVATFGVANTGLTVDTDELALITSPQTMGDPLLVRRRATTADSFDAEIALSGLDSLITPDLTRDGHQLYATYVASDQHALVVADRTGPNEFTPPTTIRSFTEELTVGSPAISADCRTLYYVSVTPNPTTTYTVASLRR